MNVAERLLAAVSALALLYGGWQTDLAGAALLAVLFVSQVIKRSRAVQVTPAAD